LVICLPIDSDHIDSRSGHHCSITLFSSDEFPWGAIAGAIAYFAICGWYIWRSLGWKEFVLPISYEISNDSLRVLSHGEEIKSFSTSKIAGFRMAGSMSLRGWLASLKFEPEWPHGEVAVMIGGVAQWEELPPVMVWGRAGAHQAEATVREALGLEAGLMPSRFQKLLLAIGTIAAFGLTVAVRAALISGPNRLLVALGGITLSLLCGFLWLIISKVESNHAERTTTDPTQGRHRRPSEPEGDRE
jgi:hypothetical protein